MASPALLPVADRVKIAYGTHHRHDLIIDNHEVNKPAFPLLPEDPSSNAATIACIDMLQRSLDMNGFKWTSINALRYGSYLPELCPLAFVVTLDMDADISDATEPLRTACADVLGQEILVDESNLDSREAHADKVRLIIQKSSARRFAEVGAGTTLAVDDRRGTLGGFVQAKIGEAWQTFAMTCHHVVTEGLEAVSPGDEGAVAYAPSPEEANKDIRGVEDRLEYLRRSNAPQSEVDRWERWCHYFRTRARRLGRVYLSSGLESSVGLPNGASLPGLVDWALIKCLDHIKVDNTLPVPSLPPGVTPDELRALFSLSGDVQSLSDFMAEKTDRRAGAEAQDGLPAVAPCGAVPRAYQRAHGLLSSVKSRVRFPNGAGGFTMSDEWMVLPRGLASGSFAEPGDSGMFIATAAPEPARVLGVVVSGRADHPPCLTYVACAGELFASMKGKLGASEMRVAATSPE